MSHIFFYSLTPPIQSSTLSLHDALPICRSNLSAQADPAYVAMWNQLLPHLNAPNSLPIWAACPPANPGPNFATPPDALNRARFDLFFSLDGAEPVQTAKCPPWTEPANT